MYSSCRPSLISLDGCIPDCVIRCSILSKPTPSALGASSLSLCAKELAEPSQFGITFDIYTTDFTVRFRAYFLFDHDFSASA